MVLTSKTRTAALALVTLAAAPIATASPVMEALKTELARSMQLLGEQPVPPYFLSYEVTEQDTASAHASFGALMGSSDSAQRTKS